MAVTGTMTVQELVSEALEKIGVTDMEESPEAAEYAKGVKALNRLLKSWQNKGYNLFNITTQSVTATTSAAHTMNPVRPIRVLGVRFKNISGTEMPMERLTRQEYDELPVKTTTGTPTTWFYDRQREDARLYVWPLLSSVTTETFEVTYEAEFEDITATTQTVPLPGEWWDAAVYALADRLASDFMVNAPNVTARSEALLREALAADREGSVWFGNYD